MVKEQVKAKAVCVLLISLCAISAYAKSDLQIDVGLRVAEASWDDGRAIILGRKSGASSSLYGMAVGLTNYNVWGIGRSGVVALGFMDGVSASFSEHDATGATFVAGPAFAAEMGRLLAFQCAASFSIGVLKVEPQAGFSDTSMAIGFALDARVCFMPEARAGPLVGARYEYSRVGDLFEREIDRGTFSFYAGVALQLSKW